jgi:hypothetical protein
MKTIITYIALSLSVAAAGVLGVANAKQKATIATHTATIKAQREMIERLAQQEAIAIHITNTFKTNAIMGKAVVDANIKNVAEQVASILKGELVNKEPQKGSK